MINLCVQIGLGERDMRALGFAALAVLALPAGACSTIVKGTTQAVAVSVSGPPIAMCELSSPGIGVVQVQAPGSVTLPLSRHNIQVMCRAKCWNDGIGAVQSTLQAMTAGNILFGGVVGLAIDAGTGAMNKYEPAIQVAMSPVPRCGRQEPAISQIPQRPHG